MALAASAALAASQGPPPLRALDGFQPGQWQATPAGRSTSESYCLAGPEPLLLGNRPANSCAFTTISDTPDGAVVTYRCAAGRSGRTSVRRDTAGLLRVDAQGVEAGRPFASRTEWRRTGAC